MGIRNLMMKMKVADQESGRKPVKIPDILIERLKPFGARFVKVEPPKIGDKNSGKAPFENEFQNNPHEANDPELQEWLNAGGNYGILLKQGVAAIETDDKKTTAKIEHRIKTFTQQSGSGRGKHFLIRTDAMENGVLLEPKTGKNLGNVQVKNKIIVGANCHHFTGGTYKIIDDSPIAWLSKEEITEIFGDALSWTGQRRKELEEQSKDEEEQIGVAIPLQDLIDLDKLKPRGNDEFQGSHPIHGSETGQNFSVNLKKNVWHCFRCNSGGGGLMWIAVENKILKCHEAQKGALKGEKFLKTIQLAKEMGFDIAGFDEDLSPDVSRFFDEVDDKPRFRAAYVADELMKENTYLTRKSDDIVFRYQPKRGVYALYGEAHIKTQTRIKLGKHTSTSRQREVLNFVKVSTYQQIEDASPHLIVLKNGVLNIKTGKLEKFDPSLFILNALGMKYDAKADCPRFKKFLSEVVRKEDIATIQEYIGYCLLRDYRFHKTLLLVGEGSNGKSTFLEVLRALLGNENVSNEPLQTLITNRFAVSQLYGKLANIYADLPAIALRDTGFFKMLTGNDTISGEYKFRDRFNFKNYAKLIFSCNQIPETPDNTVAFYRRWIIINFSNYFPDDDPNTDKNMLAKLTTPEELSGILNWALEGLRKLLKKEDFSEAKSVEETRAQYIAASDPVRAFVDECLEVDANGVETKDDVYNAYIRYCNERNLPTTTKNTFSMKLPQYVAVTASRTTRRGKKVASWQGCRLLGTKGTKGTPFSNLLETGQNKLLKTSSEENDVPSVPSVPEDGKTVSNGVIDRYFEKPKKGEKEKQWL